MRINDCRRFSLAAMWVASIAMAIGATAQERVVLVQDPDPLPESQALGLYGDQADEQPPLPRSDYWIGVRIATPWLPEQTKAQLGLEYGLMVQEAMEDNPAAKAGLKQYDILLKAGDTPLKDPADLINAVNAAKESTLTLTIFRGGKEQTIDVTPVKREEAERQIAARSITAPHTVDDVLKIHGTDTEVAFIQKLEKALNELKAKVGEQGAEIVFARPAIITGTDQRLAWVKFPEDLTVRIEKEGDQPAKVFVKRGDKEWQTTENELDSLPDEERRAVLKILRHGPDHTLTYRLVPGFKGEGREIPKALGVPGIQFQPDGKVRGRIELHTLPVVPVPLTPPGAPQLKIRNKVVPPQVPAAKERPAEPSSESGKASQELLGQILKKLEENQQQGNEAVERLQRELKQLRSEVERLRGEKRE